MKMKKVGQPQFLCRIGDDILFFLRDRKERGYGTISGQINNILRSFMDVTKATPPSEEITFTEEGDFL